MKLESLEDILTMDFDKLKSAEKTRVLTRVRQLVKAQNKTDTSEDSEAADYPYEAVSIVGKNYVALKFDLESKKARVVGIEQDTRDSDHKNYMSGARAIRKLQELVKKQREAKNE